MPENTCPKPGIYEGVPFKTYQSWEAINNSLLWTLKTRSPYHAQWNKDHPSEDTPALLFGRGIHTFVLEPDLFASEFVIKPVCDRRTKVGNAIYTEFVETITPEQSIITQDDLDAMEIINGLIIEQGNHEIIESGRGELSIVWEDPETGLLCKGRIDYERDWKDNHYITDLKTTLNASYHKFQGSVATYGYYQQMAFYSWGWKILTGQDSICTWLACEKAAPWVSMLWVADDSTLVAGHNSFREALRKYADCLEADEWPAYGEYERMKLPSWVMNQEGAFTETFWNINS